MRTWSTAAITAVALASCGSPTETATATETATSAATATTTAAAPAAKRYVPLPETSPKDGWVWSATPTPGVKLRWKDSSGVPQACTLGVAVTDGERTGWLTAGHCEDRAGVVQHLQPQPDSGAEPLGVLALGTDEVRDGIAYDFGVVWPTDPSAVPPRAQLAEIAERPISRVVPLDEARELDGETLCYSGARTGVQCAEASAGPLVLYLSVESEIGDSGAPVFGVTPDGAVELVGLLEGGNEILTAVTYLDPALQRLGVAPVL